MSDYGLLADRIDGEDDPVADALGDDLDVAALEAWSFDHFDTMTVMVADAPRADEIVLCMAVSDGARPHPRVGSGPITD